MRRQRVGPGIAAQRQHDNDTPLPSSPATDEILTIGRSLSGAAARLLTPRSSFAPEDEGDERSFVALLIRRARIALWVLIASNAFFAVTDLRLPGGVFAPVLGLKLLQVAAAAAGLRALPAARSRRAVIAIVLLVAALVAALTAWSGALAGDIVTTMILWIAAPFAATVLLPWGVWPQLGLVAIGGLAMLLNVYLARGSLEAAFEYPSVGVLVSLAISVALARESERQRRALAQESCARARAEDGLRRTVESLDLRVRERTDALERANVRLEEARDVAETAEYRFRTISNLTSDYTYCVRVRPDFTSVVEWLTEPSFERVTGYSTAETTAMGGGLAIVHPDDMQSAIARLRSLLAGESNVIEFRIIRKDGEVRWIREHGYPEIDATGRVTHIFGAAQDITERRRAEERLSEALRQRENVMNTVPDIIYTLDRGGRIRDWNRCFESVTGLRPESIATRHVAEFFAAEDRARVVEAIGVALETGFQELEANLLVPGGARLHHFTAVPLRDEQDAVVGITGVGRDVSELREMQKRTAMLLEITHDISGTLEIASILERVQSRTAALLPCDSVATFCWDEQRDGFCLTSQHGIPPRLAAALARLSFPLGMPFGGRVAAGEVVVCENARELPAIGPLLPAGALIAAPLLAHGRFLGTFVALRTQQQRQFEAPQVALCHGIAGQLAIALESAELYRSQRDEAQIAGALARVGQDLISALDSPSLLDRLCLLTTEVLGCDGSVALLWHATEGAYQFGAVHGLSAAQEEALRLLRLPAEALTELLAALAAEDVVEIDLAAAPTRWLVLPRQYGFSTALYVPLRRGRETIGILGAGSRRAGTPFTAVQKRIAGGIAQLASFALEHVRAMAALEEASRLKSEFVATMSHELRTPLNVILGYHEMLLEGAGGPLSATQLDLLERSDVSARALLHLITETLDLSRLESGRVDLDCADVSADDLLRELEAETRASWDRTCVQLEWELSEGLPHLWTDAGKLKVVMRNLLANAVKFTDTGTIALRARVADGHMEIYVEDTGVGIPANALAYIFEPFRQVDSSTTRRHGGVGLGLHIVRRLVDLLGGSIEVTSQVGVGTSFRIRMPLGA